MRLLVVLAVMLDWFFRRVLSWGLSITMEAAFCVETLKDALSEHGKQEIFNIEHRALNWHLGPSFCMHPANVGICWSSYPLRFRLHSLS